MGAPVESMTQFYACSSLYRFYKKPSRSISNSYAIPTTFGARIGDGSMTTLLSSGDHPFLGFLTRAKIVLLRFSKAIQKSRMRQAHREIELHRRLHNISNIGLMSGIAKRRPKPNSSAK